MSSYKHLLHKDLQPTSTHISNSQITVNGIESLKKNKKTKQLTPVLHSLEMSSFARVLSLPLNVCCSWSASVSLPVSENPHVPNLSCTLVILMLMNKNKARKSLQCEKWRVKLTLCKFHSHSFLFQVKYFCYANEQKYLVTSPKWCTWGNCSFLLVSPQVSWSWPY